jgi:hypothetical protein
MDSVLRLLAIAAHEVWEVHHLDVASAFLNGDLQEEIDVEQPPGFVKIGEEEWFVCTKQCTVFVRPLVCGTQCLTTWAKLVKDMGVQMYIHYFWKNINYV